MKDNKPVQPFNIQQPHFKTLLENLTAKVFLKDKNSVYITCNTKYAKDLNITPDEITGKTDFDFHPKKLAEKYRADDKKIIDLKISETFEEEYWV